MSLLSDLRVAVVHYWLLGYAGGERVVQSLVELFPQADLFTLVADERTAARFAPHRVTTSFVQRVPGSHRFHRHLLPLYPLALKQFDLRGYDLVISSESGPAKGVITSPETCHITYCHSPMRYLWDLYPQYTAAMNPLTRAVFRLAAPYLRRWDVATAAGVDYFVANSKNTAARIRKHYGREATVIYPPVDISAGYLAEKIDDYYLVVGRLVDYKRIDLAVEACTRLQRRLRVVGVGPQYKRLKRLAGSTVEFMGELNDEELHEQYAHARALLFPGEEDFGMVPVEAHSFGRPVIAYGRGGALESIHGPGAGEGAIDSSSNGLLFAEQTTDCVINAIRAFEASEHLFSPAAIARSATRFSASRFKQEMTDFVTAHIEEFRGSTQRRLEPATAPASVSN